LGFISPWWLRILRIDDTGKREISDGGFGGGSFEDV
jgi:hypothetical protein